MTQKSRFGRFSPLILVVLLANCGDDGGMGATPGGAQDNGLARDQIARGSVPAPEDVTVEGELNQHDLPLDAPLCERDLCIQAAYGVAPTLDEAGRAAIFLQIGFASGIDPATFERSPLNLAVVVDRSGSMAGEKLTSTKQALARLVDQLGEQDRLAIVLFDDTVQVLVESTPVVDPAWLKAQIATIQERGSTDMAAGLRAGYEQVMLHAGQAGISDRVMIFTDAMTNTGDTATTTFVEMATSYAAEDVGLTVFGVGIDLNQELVLAIARLRGGNYFYLEDAERIATVFDQDFDYLVTPLAYDLRFVVEPSAGFHIAQVYGFPTCSAGCAAVEIQVATVFLSRNHGAVVARIERDAEWPSGQPPIAHLTLAYEPRGGGEDVTEVLDAQYTGGEPLCDSTVFHSQQAVRKTVAIVNAALAMRRACGLYWDLQDTQAAGEILDRAETLLLAESQALEDADLAAEAELVARLAANIGAWSGGGEEYPGGNQCIDDCAGMYACTVGTLRGGPDGAGALATVFLALAGLIGVRGARRARRR